MSEQFALAAPRLGTLDSAATAFLDEMERQACLYFYEQADPSTGQVLDRANNHTTTGLIDPRFASSIAATGFGLTGMRERIAAVGGSLSIARATRGLSVAATIPLAA